MNLLKEVTLTIFSLLLIVITIVYSIALVGWIDVQFLLDVQKEAFATPNLKNALLLINVAIFILSILSIFGGQNKKQTQKTGVLLENEKGKLLISKETLENLVNSVLKGFENVYMNNIKTELDEDSKLNVNVSISVGEDVVIKDLSNAIQNQVKETIKKASDLEVKNVNISIRGVIDNNTKN